MSSPCSQMQDVMKTSKHHTLLHSELHSKNDVFICDLKVRFNASDNLEICTKILTYRLTVLGEKTNKQKKTLITNSLKLFLFKFKITLV